MKVCLSKFTARAGLSGAMLIAAWVAAISFCSPRAEASGFFFPQVGARAAGMGSNFVALADDASAIFHNPAGLINVPDKSLYGSLSLLVPSVTYTRHDGPVVFEPVKSRNPLTPVPYLGFSRRSETGRYATGAAIYGAWGTVLHYPEKGPQRYQVQNQFFMVLHATAAAAYRLTPSLSVGGQASFIYSKLDFRRSIDARDLVGLPELIQPGFDDPEFEAVIDFGTSGTGFGGGLGLLWEPSRAFRLGIFGTLPTTVAMSGSAVADISEILLLRTILGETFDTRAELDLYLPAVVRAGLLVRPTLGIKFTADLVWVDWSRVKRQVLVLESIPGIPEITLIRNWSDGWTVGAGVEWSAPRGLEIRAGWFYEPSVVPSSTILLDGPDADKHGLALGITLPFGPRLLLDLTGEWRIFSEVVAEDSVYDTLDPEVIGVNSNGVYGVGVIAVSTGIRYRF